MKFEAGKTYYGINPGESASWREITILAIEGSEIAAKIVDLDGKVKLSILKDLWVAKYYQETPWHPEPKAGDRVTFEWQGAGISHYVLREKFVNRRTPAGYGSSVQWVCLRIYKDGTTRLCLIAGDLDDAIPYEK